MLEGLRRISLLLLFPLLACLGNVITAAGPEKTPANRRLSTFAVFCDGPMPTFSPLGFGRNSAEDKRWEASDFSSLHDLCAKAGNPRANLGAYCRANLYPSAPDSPLRVLAFDSYLSIIEGLFAPRLQRYCKEFCECPHDLDEFLSQDFWRAAERHGHPVPARYAFSTRITIPSVAPRAGLRIGTGRTRGTAGSTSSGLGTCNGECKGFRCRSSNVPGGSSCVCLAKRVGATRFIPMGCAAQARSGPWGRRSDLATIGEKDMSPGEQACPCNVSYVSHACCLSPEGLVWESRKAWLGELIMENDQVSTHEGKGHENMFAE